MKKQNTIDQSLQDLIDIIHYTENVSAKIHGLRDENDIYKTLVQEFAKSKHHHANVLLLVEDGAALRVTESSVSSGALNTMAKLGGMGIDPYRIDLNKSSIFAQVAREGKTVEASGSEILRELVPRHVASLLVKVMDMGNQPSILTPLRRHGKTIGVFTVTSTSLTELLIPSVRNLAQHISAALEMADEHVNRIRAEKALQESEQYFRTLIENAPDMILVIDADGSIRYASPSVQREHGYSLDDLIGKNGFDLVHPDDIALVTEAFTRSTEKPGQMISLQLRVRNKYGSWRNVEFVSRNLLDDPSVKGIVVNYRDVTERRQAEGLFSVLAANAQIATYIVQGGLFQFVNPAFAATIGFVAEELVGKPALSIVHPDDREKVREDAIRILKGEGALGYGFRIVAKDGSIRHVYEKIASIEYQGGRAVLGNFVDITAIKKTEGDQQQLLAAFEEQNRIITAANAELEVAMEKLE